MSGLVAFALMGRYHTCEPFLYLTLCSSPRRGNENPLKDSRNDFSLFTYIPF